MKLKESWLFRLEFFGGILISKKNFHRKELNFEEALFVLASQYTNFEEATKIVCELLEKASIDVSNIATNDIFEGDICDDLSECDYQKIFNLVKKKYEEIKDKKILSFPLELIIYPNMNCNLQCKFCFIGNRKNTAIYNASEWGRVLNEAKENGVLSVSILGGEPTLYYDIDKLLLECEKLKINTIITTNALKIRESTRNIILNSKYITPTVSIQTLDNLNCLLMGCKVENQLSFIDECIIHKKDVRINSVYTFQTIEQIKKIYDFCVLKGVKRYSVANYSNVKDNVEMTYSHDLLELAELDKEMKRYITSTYDSKVDLPDFSVEGCMLYSVYANQINEKLTFSSFEKQYYGCRAKYTKMEIYSDGSVYPCCRYETLIESTSNIFQDENTLKKIWWNDKNYSMLRKQKTKCEQCFTCAFLDICEGGCYPSRYKESLCKKDLEYIRDLNCKFIERKNNE